IDCEKIAMGTNPAYLGAVLQDDPKGVKLGAITPNSPAVTAMLKTNDIIVSIDKQPTKNADALRTFLAKSKPGTKVTLEIVRDGKPMTINMTLGERPEVAAARLGPGLAVRGEMTKDGLKVTEVSARSLLGRTGVQINDVIQFLDKQKITTVDKLNEVFRAL